MPTESRRIPADIDQHVVDGAVCASHQLGFATPGSAVHAADDALPRTGLRVLDEGCRGSGSAEIFVEDARVERAGEQAAVVAERLWDQDENVGKVGRFDTHMEMLS